MAKAIKEMMFDKKPTYEDLEKQIEALKFENEQVYKKLYDNSTISIWNEDFTLVFEEIEKIKTLKIVDVNKYLNENPEVVFLLLEKLKINSVNQATLKIFRACSKEDFLNNVHRTFGNGATEVFIKLIVAIWNNKKTFSSEVNYKTLDGDEFAAMISLNIPQTLLEQKTVPVTIQDISALKEAEYAKKRSISNLQQAQKIGKIGSWEWEWKTGAVYWSDEMLNIFGLKRGEIDLTSKNVGKFIVKEDREKVNDIIRGLYKGKGMKPFKFRILRSNSEIRHLNILGIEVVDGKVFGVTQDVTDKEKIENDLKAAQALGKVGSWLFDIATQEIEWSNAMFNIWGLDSSQGAPQYDELLESVHPDYLDLWNNSVQKAIENGTPYDIEHKICLPDGNEKVVRCICEPVLCPNGMVISLKGTGQDVTEQKLLDAALVKAKDKAEESENHLNNIINNIGDPVFVKDKESRLLIVNDAFCTLYGYNRNDIIGKTLGEGLPSEETGPVFDIDRQLVLDGIENVTEKNAVIRDGKSKRISTRKTRFIDSEGNVFIVGVIHDITERFKTETIIKEAKERAEANERRFQILMQNLEAGVVVHAPDTSIVQCNDRASEILGINQEDVQDKGLCYINSKLINFDKSPLALSEYPVNKIAETKESINNQIIRLIGPNDEDVKWTTLNGFPVLNDVGEITEIVTVFIDITEQRQNEKDKLKAKLLLDRTEKELSDAQTLAKIGSWLVKTPGNKMEWSKEMYNIWGYDYNEELPDYEDVIDRVHPDDKLELQKILDKAFTLGKPYNVEFRILIPHKPQKTIRSICQPVTDNDGEVISLAGTNQDITQQKKIAQELIRAKEKAEESDRLKSAFLANLSHEMRTPMNGILGFSELLRRKNISEEKKDIYLELIEKEGHRLLSFISNIVDISKIESNIINIENSHLNLNSLIDDLYSKYQLKLEGTNVKLEVNKGLSGTDSGIETDENKLVQILSNLLENAIKFTKEGSIEFGYTLKEEILQFYVKDSGIGIDEEEQKNIFDRFTQGKREQTHNLGVGLGLSIVKGLIKILNGSVWIESKMGEGSIFYFTIPYKKVVDKITIVNDPSETTLENGDFTILIAEDDNLSFLYVKACLSNYNCTVIRAVNGKEAVKIVNKNPSLDLVLMDINMPEMDGNDALVEIRKTNKEIKIIAQTGLAMSGDKEKMLNAGFTDYVSKPISTSQLISTINKHLKIAT
ncbi:PAS domain S-box protein [Dokdonia sp. Asnod2-E02]|uniref:PAS domain S-box protein n=1 Tax=Dokdonia sp. Asnod2-E02 TaxID=3160574 RepID=UPI003862F849